MSKFDHHISLCIEQFSQMSYPHQIDVEKLKKIAKGLGPTVYLPDASLISCADTKALERVKQRFLIQKMGFGNIDETELDKAIQAVCEDMISIEAKKRAVFYYLLLDKIENRNSTNIPNVIPAVAFSMAASRSFSAPTRSFSESSSSLFEHKVARGETLYKIAVQNGISVEELKLLNNLTSDNIPLGKILKVRRRAKPTTPKPPTPAPTPTPTNIPTSQPNLTKSYLDLRKEVSFSVKEMDEFIAKIGDNEVNMDNKYKVYSFSFITPQGKIQNISFRDNYVRSRHMDRDYPQGIFYFSSYKPDLAFVSAIVKSENIGLTKAQLEALMFTSLHEGNFDAVSSFDRCIFSFGFIQFIAWAKEGMPGSLNTLMQSIKKNEPTLFEKYFFKLGMDMENGVFTVLDDMGRKLRSKEAWRYVQSNYQLTAAFIKSAYEPALQKEQLRHAKIYIDDFNRVLREINSAPLNKLIDESQAALNVLVSLCINKGGGGLATILKRVLPKMTVFTEIELFDKILENESADARIVNRINMAKEGRTILV